MIKQLLNIRFKVGPVAKVVINSPSELSPDRIVTSKYVKDCGLREACKANEFAVHVYTGKDRTDEPKICVDGR